MGYIYLNQSQEPAVTSSPQSLRTKKPKMLALPLFGIGLFLILWAVIPILRFQISDNSFRQILSPLSANYYTQAEQGTEETTDLTQINNWFTASPAKANLGVLDSPVGSTYTLTIPKLKINQAVVTIGGQDLKASLVHYGQTALPGQLGSPVIFGHSVLPQFFNSKNYLTIFSTLYKLEQGDEITLRYDKSTYKYVVEEMYEVQPTDLSVLEQRYDNKTLTVITCSPPGTYLRRLVVRATLEERHDVI
jgi:sortase A